MAMKDHDVALFVEIVVLVGVLGLACWSILRG